MVCQFFNIIICQLRRKKILRTRWNNPVMVLGVFGGIVLSLAMFYSMDVGMVVEAKDNNFVHMGVNGAVFGVAIVGLDEVRKAVCRRWKED